ncbi:hypothetical protein F511_44219 [Dorcoceras hygrometricum]|uniref:Dystroglycan-like n=1 Tax=Dorcoceras hygrometricum TaxID=472368 RepID=A0A2Z7A3P5_9LAMI|nr:hypothetical protein F511_44219 [Dorcoceras hygrometricum]
MASSFYSNTQHIDFEYVLAMDYPGMVSMFQDIFAYGLEGFLGCPVVIYEAVLVDFFENVSVRDGVLISTVAGQLVEISEEWFAESFDLPVDGLADLSEIPKDVVFYARIIVSMSDPHKTKARNKYEVKPQYEELSKQINMQHAINQCYECMRAAKGISQLGQCINRQNISGRLYTTANQPGNHRSVIIGARHPIIARR